MGRSATVAHDRDDNDLLALYVAGDRDAFAELVSRYRGSVYGYLVRCGISPAAREDLLQEIFMRVHRGAARFEPHRPLRVWLFTIVANTVRSSFRKKRHEFATNREATSHEADGLALAEAHELEAFLAESMTRLPLIQREVIALTCTGSMEDREAAAILDLPIATVKTHRRRARLHLARALARRRQRTEREAG